MDWAKTTARGDEKHLSFEIQCDLYKRFYGTYLLHMLMEMGSCLLILILSQWDLCSNYIFILNLTPGFNGLGKDICETKQETFMSFDWVRLILENWRYIYTFRNNTSSLQNNAKLVNELAMS